MGTKPFHKKPIYDVFCQTRYGIGCQPVKADSKREARDKFRKRWPKRRIVSVDLSSGESIIDAI